MVTLVIWAFIFVGVNLFIDKLAVISSIVLLIATFSIIYSKDQFYNIYQFLFNFFYITPLIFLDYQEISSGTFFTEISLSGNETKLMVFYLLSTSLLFSYVSIFSESKCFSLKNNQIQINKFSWFITILLFLTFLYINIYKGLKVHEIGYQHYMAGELIFYKSLFLIFLEVILIYLILSYGKNNWAAFMFFCYFFSVMLSGQRIPAAFSMLAYMIIFWNCNYKKTTYLAFFLAIFAFAIPILMWVQDFRNEILVNLDFYWITKSYVDFFHVVWFSFDTVKAVFVTSLNSLDYNPFGKIYLYLSLLLNRTFGLEVFFDNNTFGDVFTKEIAPELFEQNVTFASSAAAEFYHLFGMAGVCLHVIYVFFICKMIWYALQNFGLLSAFIGIVIARGFWGMVRNEPFGFVVDTAVWILLGLSAYAFVEGLKMLLNYRSNNIKF